ncbi:MAG: ABC transporter ATP-binding protein [Acidobacteriaceae bacterium]
MNATIQTTTQATIRTEALTKRFGKTDALSGVQLTVPEGSIFALVGPNGAGKTTLIKLAMNLLRPTAGTAWVLGKASETMTGRDLNRIGYVSENQEYPEWMTVGAMLAYLRPFYPQWDVALERQLVTEFDLPLDRRIKQLSRGMKMKAAMAGALAFRPALLVLDEPFSGLDPLVRDELIEGLLDRSPETTVFLSSHDLSEIESFSSHVAYLEQGRLLFAEEMAALSERFREVTVTLGATRLEGEVPATWLGVEATEAVVKFVHSDCRGEATAAEIRERFPDAKDIELEPMPLRAIFLAVARSERAKRAQRGLQERRSA